MRLGIDIDGTIKDTHTAAVKVFNETLGKSVTIAQVSDFHLDNAYGLSRKEGRRMWRKLEGKIYGLGLPLKHASEVLNDLVLKEHNIYFITARPNLPKIKEVTVRWLKCHKFPYNGKNLFMGSADKAKIAIKQRIELFFEDDPKHIDNLLNNNIRTIIVDARYNRNYSDDVERIQDWREVYKWVT